MEREIMIGDLVRIAPRRAVTTTHLTQVGLVVGFTKSMQSGWSLKDSAKIEWTNGTQTVTGLSMLELAQYA